MKKLITPTALFLLLALSSPTDASLMAIWDFGPDAAGYTLNVTTENVVGTPTLVAANAEYDVDGKDGYPYRDAAGTFHDAGQAVGWNDVSGAGANDAYWIMTINTTGWQDMTIRWDHLSDNTGANLGPTSFDLHYRVGSGTWIPILNDNSIKRDDTWWEFSHDLSSITAIENQSDVYFRVSDLNQEGTTRPDGSYRFDNLELTGVPEPATVLLLGLGSLALLRRKRG